MPLSDDYDLQPVGELQPKPSFGKTFQESLEKPFLEGEFLLQTISGLSSQEQREKTANRLDVINQNLADPRIGYTQMGLNMVAEIGSSIVATAPLAFGGAEIAGIAGGVLGAEFDAIAPEVLVNAFKKPITKLTTSELADYLPRISTKELAQGVATGYGAYKGMIIPQHVFANYQKENDVLDPKQALTDWGNDNYGFLIPTVPLAAGYLLHKIASVGKEAKIAGNYARALAASHEETVKARKSIYEAALGVGQIATEKESKKIAIQSQLEKEIETQIASGNLDKKDAAWLTDYLENPSDHGKLAQHALSILSQASIPIDRATGKHWRQILDKKSIDQLQKSVLDELATDFDEGDRSLLKNYIGHNAIDIVRSEIGDNPNLLMAYKGYIDYLDKKLAGKVKALAEADKLLNEHVFGEPKDLFNQEAFPYIRFNEINKEKLGLMKKLYELKNNPSRFKEPLLEYTKLLREYKEKYPHLEDELEILTGNMLSQENIFKHILKNKLNIKKLPYHVPANIKEKLSVLKKLSKAKTIEERTRLNKVYESLHFIPISKEIELALNDVLSNIDKHYKKSESYRRLEDLASYRDDAKLALHRIDLEQNYNKQAALKNVLDTFVRLVDSNLSRLAKPENVINYMQKRLEKQLPTLKHKLALEEEKPIVAKSEGKAETKEGKAIEEEKEQVNRVEKSNTDELKKDFTEVNKKLQQFRENETALDELMQCVGSKLNG